MSFLTAFNIITVLLVLVLLCGYRQRAKAHWSLWAYFGFCGILLAASVVGCIHRV